MPPATPPSARQFATRSSANATPPVREASAAMARSAGRGFRRGTRPSPPPDPSPAAPALLRPSSLQFASSTRRPRLVEGHLERRGALRSRTELLDELRVRLIRPARPRASGRPRTRRALRSDAASARVFPSPPSPDRRGVTKSARAPPPRSRPELARDVAGGVIGGGRVGETSAQTNRAQSLWYAGAGSVASFSAPVHGGARQHARPGPKPVVEPRRGRPGGGGAGGAVGRP